LGNQSDGRPASSPQPAIRIAATIGIPVGPVPITLIGTEFAAAHGVWAMVFLSVAIMGAAVLAGKRGGLFKV
jgi:biotin transporter BioY